MWGLSFNFSEIFLFFNFYRWSLGKDWTVYNPSLSFSSIFTLVLHCDVTVVFKMQRRRRKATCVGYKQSHTLLYAAWYQARCWLSTLPFCSFSLSLSFYRLAPHGIAHGASYVLFINNLKPWFLRASKKFFLVVTGKNIHLFSSIFEVSSVNVTIFMFGIQFQSILVEIWDGEGQKIEKEH